MPVHLTTFTFYGGKGGVGKTTCAAARAVAEARSGRRVLVVSTDPAHSLGDAFDRRLASRPRGVAPRLDAVELDAPRAFARWLARHHAALADIVEHGTWLDRNDAETLLDLPIPGVDELVGILEIARLSRAETGRYDEVIVDMAPTGHALRLMSAPGAVAAAAEVLDALQESHRIVRDRIARVVRADAADALIALLARQAADVSALLHDRRATRFAWVTLAERLAVAETEDGLAALAQQNLRVNEVVVNRLLVNVDPCPVCIPRRAEEAKQLAAIERSIAAGRRLTLVPAVVGEPRGLRALRLVGAYLTGDRTIDRSALRASRPPAIPPTVSTISVRPAFEPDGTSTLRRARLIFVGGKGGVGKTTVAAALALRLAASRRSQSILLLSTDPAHSLSDVLGAPIGSAPVAVPGAPANLRGCELDAARAFHEKRRAIDAALAQVGAAAPETVHLLDLAPPGIDELFGMMTLVDARGSYDVIVVDTAPTGHALRLLALPEAAREWVQVLMRLLLKYRDVVRPGPLGAELVEASRSIRELQAAVRDETTTRFVVVSRAARLPGAETVRLMANLRALHISPGALVFNGRTLAPGACRRCRASARAERREMRALRAPRDCAIIQAPLVVPPPRGVAVLSRWAQGWTADKL